MSRKRKKSGTRDVYDHSERVIDQMADMTEQIALGDAENDAQQAVKRTKHVAGALKHSIADVIEANERGRRKLFETKRPNDGSPAPEESRYRIARGAKTANKGRKKMLRAMVDTAYIGTQVAAEAQQDSVAGEDAGAKATKQLVTEGAALVKILALSEKNKNDVSFTRKKPKNNRTIQTTHRQKQNHNLNLAIHLEQSCKSKILQCK